MMTYSAVPMAQQTTVPIGSIFANLHGTPWGRPTTIISPLVPPAGGQPVPMPFSAVPDMTGQIAPQGIISSALGFAAPALGGLIGGAFGNKKLGQQIGSVAGIAAHFLPFQAGPGEPVQYVEVAPQGILGNIAGAIGAPVGGAIGGMFGNRQAGQQIGGVVGGLARQFLPFQAGPGEPVQYVEMAPQGILGNIAGALGAPVGGLVGGLLGNRQAGQQIGGVVGGLAKQFLPFQAGPGEPVQYVEIAPQGIFGDIAGAIGAPVGGAIGGLFGNRQAGQQIGGVVGGLAKQFLPFQAGPGEPVQYVEIAPQGIFGNIAGALGGAAGGAIGGLFGNRRAGQQIGGLVGGLAKQFLPFQAGPGEPVQYVEVAPQGIFGDIAGAIAAPVGGAIGGLFGNRQAGQQIGGFVGGLAKQFLPFQAGPGEPVQYVEIAPQGILGNIAGALGGAAGGAIGGLFGNRRAGQQIGGLVGGLAKQFLPFQAGPGEPVQFVEVTPQGVVGDLLGGIGTPVGGFVGGLFGNRQAGEDIGGTLGGLAQRYLPYSVLPQQADYSGYAYNTVH